MMRCIVPSVDSVWLAQPRRGSVEPCVLALLRRENGTVSSSLGPGRRRWTDRRRRHDLPAARSPATQRLGPDHLERVGAGPTPQVLPPHRSRRYRPHGVRRPLEAVPRRGRPHPRGSISGMKLRNGADRLVNRSHATRMWCSSTRTGRRLLRGEGSGSVGEPAVSAGPEDPMAARVRRPGESGNGRALDLLSSGAAPGRPAGPTRFRARRGSQLDAVRNGLGPAAVTVRRRVETVRGEEVWVVGGQYVDRADPRRK